MLSRETAEESAAGDGESARVSPRNDDAEDGDSDGGAGEGRREGGVRALHRFTYFL